MLQAAAQQNVPARASPGAHLAAPPLLRLPRRPCFPSPTRRTSPPHRPTKETVNAFCRPAGDSTTTASGRSGHSEDRFEGVSKVVIYVGDKTGKQKPTGIQFFVLPDGKHIIAGDEMIPFGEHPLRGVSRRRCSRSADGPYRGCGLKGPGDRRVCRLPVPALQGSAGQHGQAG